MDQSIIVVGDLNSSGGPVITGSHADTIDDKPIARLGDLVDCPVGTRMVARTASTQLSKATTP